MTRSLRLELKKIWYMIISGFRVEFLFEFGLVFQAFNVLFGVTSFFFMFKLFQGPSSEALAAYNVDPLAYVVLGMAMNSLLMTSLYGFFSAVASTYGGELKKIIATPTSPFTLFIGRVISGYIQAPSYLVSTSSSGPSSLT